MLSRSEAIEYIQENLEEYEGYFKIEYYDGQWYIKCEIEPMVGVNVFHKHYATGPNTNLAESIETIINDAGWNE